MRGKRSTTKAVRHFLTPVIRLLIELGFTFRDFNEVAKTVYVEIASNEYGIKGRKTNQSRVAIMTGLTRREVARLKGVIDHDPLDIPARTSVVTSVLSAWHQDKQYLEADGKPKVLRLTGEDSLCSLLDRYRGDIPRTALIKELERVKAISVRGNAAKVESRYYLPFELDDQSLDRFGSVMNDVGNTIVNNMLARHTSGARFEGRTTNNRISVHAYDAFKKYLDRRAQEFLEEADDWLSDHAGESPIKETMRLGVGLYSIAGPEREDEN